MYEWLQPLKNKDDSCYMDVVLNAFFLDPSRGVENSLEDISTCVPANNVCGTTSHQATRDIQSTIRDVADNLKMHREGVNYYLSLDDIRDSAKACPVLNDPERFDKDGMNDPSVFVDYLVELFPCMKNLNSGESPLVYLERGPLKKINGMELSDVVDMHADKTGEIFDNSELVIFDITRLEGGKYNQNVKVVPDEILDEEQLELTAVVVWKDYHYSVYVIVDGIWYYLDDTEEYVEKVGSYEDLLEHNDEFVSWDGKLFFYVALS
jgi:hypothetical protein